MPPPPTSTPPRRTETAAPLFFAALFPWIILALLYLRLHFGNRANEDAAMLPPSSINIALTLALLLNTTMILLGLLTFYRRSRQHHPRTALFLAILTNLITLTITLYLLQHR